MPPPTSRLVDQIDALQSLTHVLARARDLPQTFSAALDGLIRLLSASRAAVLLFDGQHVMRFVAWRNLSDRYRKALDGHSTPWPVGALDASPVLAPDIRRYEPLAPFLDAIAEEGIGAIALVPLVAESGVIGKFTVYYDEVHEFAPADVLLAQTVAQQVAFAVERRRIEQDLLLQKTLLEAQSEAAADGVLVVSRSGQIVSFNRRFVELWNVPASVIAMRSDEAAIRSVLEQLESPEAFLDRVRYLYDHPTERSRDRIALKDGRRLERYSAPVIGPDGTDFGRVWFFHDVTEQSALLEREHAARAEAEAASRAKDEFIAMLSHELRTPLNAMMGWVQLLQRSAPDEARRLRALEAIGRNAQLQAQLIADILDVSRIVKGKLPLSIQLAAVQPLVLDVLESFGADAAAKGIVLECEFDPAIPAIAFDAARFQQVLWNLVANAIKFTPGGGRVAVSATLSNGMVAITVQDTGVGISPGFLPHVFERYRQADGSAARAHGGLGLGLAIVRHIVEMHGGTVEAASKGIGLGAAFTVAFPARTTEAQVVETQVQVLSQDSGADAGT